ncbi:ATP-binding domain-containing protein, partial [bacterium]|nr:ATP-binding domain-containing protein [bacterium]
RTALEADTSVKGRGKLENVDEMSSATKEYEKTAEESILGGFLEGVALLTSADALKEGVEAVTLMTLHSAKGLEFPVVFIAGLEEGLFPLSRAMESPEELEEERRLMYVGMTRAREKLFLSRSHWRRRYGAGMGCLRSRFLDEIPTELVEVEGYGQGDWSPKRDVQADDSRLTGPDDEFTPRVGVGSVVRHPKFGIGKVVELSGYADDLKLTVAFKDKVHKKLLARYARLEILR